jgi:hypothetical protein
MLFRAPHTTLAFPAATGKTTRRMKACAIVFNLLIFPLAMSAGELATIALKDGSVLANVTISRKDGLGVSIRSTDGVRMVPFANMTEESKSALGYSEALEAEYLAQDKARKDLQLQSRAKEARWAKWHDHLKQMKDHLLYEPVHLRQQGATNHVVASFLSEQESLVQAFEEKFRAARRVVASEEEFGASEADLQRLVNSMFEGTVYIGMPEAAALVSWGPPTRKSATLDSSGTTEHWVYRRGRADHQHVFVSRGQVVLISD